MKGKVCLVENHHTLIFCLNTLRCSLISISINRLFEPTYWMYEPLISIENFLWKYYVKTPVCLKINIFHFFIFIFIRSFSIPQSHAPVHDVEDAEDYRGCDSTCYQNFDVQGRLGLRVLLAHHRRAPQPVHDELCVVGWPLGLHLKKWF